MIIVLKLEVLQESKENQIRKSVVTEFIWVLLLDWKSLFLLYYMFISLEDFSFFLSFLIQILALLTFA